MITNKFNSNKNKYAIKAIINENVEEKYNKTINNNYDGMIDDTMQYVLSQVSSTPPKGMKEDDYLYLMNKKVYDIVTPLIIKNISEKKVTPVIQSNTKANIQANIQTKNNNPLRVTEASFTNKNNNNNNILTKIREKNQDSNRDDLTSSLQDKIFDPILLKNYETAQTLMDYPVPSTTKISNDKIDVKIKSLENERSNIIPKIKPIDFTIKDSTEKNNNTTQLYNDLLSTYNSQINNMSDFENGQKNMNKNVEIIENININKFIENDNSFTSIDLLRDPTLTNNFFEVSDSKSLVNNLSKNVAYNRNDIETFIGYNELINSDKSKIEDSNIIDPINSKFIASNTYNNGLMYNTSNGNNLEFGPSTYPNNPIMIDEPKFKKIENKNIIVIDSADRDLYQYPNQTMFQVKFSPAGNSLRYETYYDKYNTLIIREKTIIYGDNSNTSIPDTFDNVKCISCKTVNVPTNIIYIGTSDQNTNLNATGISIFNQSYLYLIIPEIRSPYTGSNTIAQDAFAKLLVNYSANQNNTGTLSLSIFTTLNTSSEDEKFIYDPITLGKLDKLTLTLLNKNGIPYNAGIDKLFINNFTEGSYKYDGYCGNQFITTIINIQSVNNEYAKYCKLYSKRGECNILNSHPIKNGDLIYFYNTRPNNDQVVYFEDYISISKLKYDKNNNKLNIYLNYLKIIDNKEEKIIVNLKDVLGNNINIYKDYYIVFYDTKKSYYYYLKVDTIYDNYITVEYIDTMPIFKNYSSIKIGIAKNNLRGNNDDNPHSLFYKGGYNVINVGTTSETQWSIEINMPYYNLPEYILNSTVYYPGEIFLIQEKLQISYTFEITNEVKDYDKLKSGLN